MNERIKELKLEAIAYADSKVPVNARYNDIYYSIVCGKFAELIVREYSNFFMENDLVGPAVISIAEKYFGVEE